MIHFIRHLLGLERERRAKARAVELLQRQSDATLTRARHVERQAERDRLASAVANTAKAVRRRGHQ